MRHLYYGMVCRVEIGNVRFDHVKSIRIRKSVKKLSDTAKIILPREYRDMYVGGKRESLAGRGILDFIRQGDSIRIFLGYDDDLQLEFEGYAERIGADAPLEIECRDEMYQLKRGSLSQSYRTVGLAELLGFIAPAYGHDIIDDVPLGKLTIDNASPFAVLEMLRKDYGLHSFFKGKTLCVGFPYSISPTTAHQFVVGRNVRDSGGLKFTRKEDVRLKIRAVSINGDGTRIVKEYGEDGGTLRTLHFTDKTAAELAELAEKNHGSLSFDGLEGKLLSWGLPRTQPGDAADIRNPDKPEQDGRYLLEGVNIRFDGDVGFQRANQLGAKL